MNEMPKDCRGTLIACGGGAYLPSGEQITQETLKCWQRELFEVVDELAKLERWHPDAYDLVICSIERQPISTLKPDLSHFTERLRVARATAQPR